MTQTYPTITDKHELEHGAALGVGSIGLTALYLVMPYTRVRLRSALAGVARGQGLRVGAAGTHPFARWQDQKITAEPRYAEIVEDMQDVARANLIFGLHVHVGVPDRDVAVHNVVDPTVVGGIVTQVGDTLLDGSVRSRLAQLRDAF